MDTNQQKLNYMDSDQANFERAKLVWDEYKYRHELCWKLLFQLTIAVVAVSLVPYTYLTITRRLGYFIIILPAIAVALAVLSVKRMRTELTLWKKIKEKHVELQNVLEIVKPWKDTTRQFGPDVLGSLYALITLAVINIFWIIIYWIPNLDDIIISE